jgi:hypothetical protein
LHLSSSIVLAKCSPYGLSGSAVTDLRGLECTSTQPAIQQWL